MTVHNEALKEDIAPIVLMPGDPLRAQKIVIKYLEDYKLVNQVRNMYAYTGYYKGKRITVMASGMGIPSIGIYSYELFKFYDVNYIIRVGTTGAITEDLNLYDLLLVNESYSKSSYAKCLDGYEGDVVSSSEKLNGTILKTAIDLGHTITLGRVNSKDTFYDNEDINKLYEDKKCLACEMETFSLFYNAKRLGKDATCILTVSDNLVTKEETSSDERQNKVEDMIVLALESTLNL